MGFTNKYRLILFNNKLLYNSRIDLTVGILQQFVLNDKISKFNEVATL